MKKASAKLLVYLLAMAMVLALLPSLAAADNTTGEWAFTVDGTSATVTAYTGPGGDVIIPDTLGGKTVLAIGPEAFAGKAAIKSVTMPAGITVIGDGAFRNCTALSNVAMPAGLLGIGEYAFAGCTALTAVTIPKWVNNVSAHAFEGCANLAAAYFEGQPPAISTSAFTGTSASLTLYGHATQTGWVGYTGNPAKTYCIATRELLDGSLPVKTAITTPNGKVSPVPADPVRTGYLFGGWHREAACLTKWDFSKDTFSNDIVLYAKWTPTSCKITFDSQGGSAVAPITAPYGSPIPLPADPTRPGSVFGGWYREAACVTAWDSKVGLAQGDMTLFARWVTPAVPVDPKALSASVSSIAVRWKPSAFASGYEVYCAVSPKGQYELAATVYENTFRDQGLVLGKPYFYKVKAFKQLETERVYSAESVVVSAKPVPAAPIDVKTVWRDSRSVRVTWGAVQGATQYELWRADNAAGPFTLVKTTDGKGHTDSGLADGTNYTYKVRAFAVVRGKKIYGPFSAVANATAAPVG